MAAPTRTSLSAMALASVYAALLPVAPQLCERRSAQSPEGLPPPALRRSPGAARRWRGEAGFGPSSGRGLSRTGGSLSLLLRDGFGGHLFPRQAVGGPRGGGTPPPPPPPAEEPTRCRTSPMAWELTNRRLPHYAGYTRAVILLEFHRPCCIVSQEGGASTASLSLFVKPVELGAIGDTAPSEAHP